MSAFKKMLTVLKGWLSSPLVRRLLRRPRNGEESPSRVEARQVARAMTEEEEIVATSDSNMRVTSVNQIQSAITIEGEDASQALSVESPAARSLVTQSLQLSPPLLPTNIVCILPGSELGIQFAEAIRALSPLKTETEIVTSTRGSASHADEISVASNPPVPPPLPGISELRAGQLALTQSAVSSKASTRSKKRRKVFRFLDLPAEIRWIVYQFHFESQDIKVSRSAEVTPNNPSSSYKVRKCVVRISASTIPLRFVCRQIYDEATAAMLCFSNFDLMTCTEGPHKVYSRTMPPEIVRTMQRFSCNNVYFARQLWKAKRTFENKECLGNDGSTSDALQQLNQPKAGSSFKIGSLTCQEYQISRLNEISLYATSDLLRGLTIPRWMTELWFSDEDAKLRRVLEIVEVRQFLDDFEKYATGACTLRFKSTKEGLRHREIELKANGPIIVRGVTSAWQELAEQRIQRWLQLSKGRVIMFEDSENHGGSKAKTPIMERS